MSPNVRIKRGIENEKRPTNNQMLNSALEIKKKKNN